jgi:nicotinate phosphoribosyltransferase
MFHPVHTYVSKFVTNFEAKELHQDIFRDGKLVYDSPSICDMQRYAEENLSLLWDEYKRTLNPEEYPVDLSQKCWDNKIKNIQEVQRKLKKDGYLK